jgi:NAD(P)H dehydrogenase (quinone)
MTTPVYAVTGASGRLGRLAVEQLAARGVPPPDIVALVRTPAKAVSLAASGVQVRQAEYSRPATLAAALSGVTRLLLVSGSDVGHLVPQHTNVIEAAKTAGIARIVYTSMLNADHSTSPLAGEHRETERVLREAGVPHIVLRNGYYAEGYADHLGEYLATGEIIGAAGHGRMSTASRQDYATAAAAALFSDEDGNRTYELGGAAYDITGLAEIITDVTGTKVTYRDLSADGYAAELQRSGLDETTARFVAALDVAVARGDLETSSTDLADLLGHPATGPADVVHAAYDLVKVTSRTAVIGLIGAGRIGGTLAGLAVDAGYHVVLSNDRGPATLSDLAARLGPSARAAAPTEAARAGDLVIVAVPLLAYREIPAEQLVGKVVLDATNYMPDRDGHIAALDDESATSSQLLQGRLAGSHLVKAFNTVFFEHLPALARPHGAADRSSLAIAGDEQLAKTIAGAFVDAIGYDPYDAGLLSEGWRFQAGATPYVYGADGSFDHPQPTAAQHIADLLSRAGHNVK